MFICKIYLYTLLKQEDGSPAFIDIAEFNFDPGWQKEEVILTNWEVWGKVYALRAKVLAREKVLSVSNDKLRKEYGNTAYNGLYTLRIFLEAEDRDTLLEICNTLEKHKID
ncbi:MAG TPA: hypothetical protein VIQ31_06495 [Phormidium sp.]